MYISLETIEFFFWLTIAGSLYGYHCYKQGLQRGAEDVILFLEEQEIIYIDPETGEIERF